MWKLALALLVASATRVQSQPNADDDGPCASNPCQNGATCVENGEQYECTGCFGYEGIHCDVEVNDCVDADGNGVCMNGATCTDHVGYFQCECPFGYDGANCEIVANFTLQQWKSSSCEMKPWRCFRLQIDKCIDTGFTDGNIGNKDNWYGKLVLGSDGKYTVDLCWGKKDDEDEQCKCDNHFTGIPKLGKNSFGPPTLGIHDSDGCHKLQRITASKLVNSSGVNSDSDDPNLQNVDCSSPDGASRNVSFLSWLLSALLATIAFRSSV